MFPYALLLFVLSSQLYIIMLHLIVPFKPDEKQEGTITRRASSWLKHMLLARQYTRLRLTDGYFPDRPYREYYLVGWSYVEGHIEIRYSTSFEPSSPPPTTFPHMFSVSPPRKSVRVRNCDDDEQDDETKSQIYEGMASRAKAAGERRWQVVAPSKKAKLQSRMAAVRAAKLASSSSEEDE